MARLSGDMIRSLAAAPDYRSFLKAYFATAKAEGNAVSLRRFAEAAGMRSQAFARDVMLGQKRLTLSSIDKFAAAMSLPADVAAFFRALVLRDEPELTTLPVAATTQKVETLRARVQQRHLAEPELERLYAHHHWPTVYAALGDEHGATEDEIARRSRLSPRDVERVLTELTDAALVTRRESDDGVVRFAARDAILLIKALAGKFQENFQAHAREMRRQAASRFAGPETLFLTADFSCDAALQKELVTELRQTISDFVARHERPRGDRVANLCLGFFLRE